MNKRIPSALLAMCMALSLLPMPPAGAAKSGFSDVRDDAYYADAVAWAVAQDITRGTTETTFSPNNTCTIAQITTFLWRACGSPEPGINTSPFNDVAESHYSYKAALWAYENGITLSQTAGGIVAANQFLGNENCRRYVVMLFMWILMGRPETSSHSFSDVPPDTDSAKAVSWAVENGITNGTSATTFAPNNTCTRAQIVTFLYRADQADVLPGHEKKTSVVIDGVDVEKDARKIQDNLYYIITNGDYTYFDEYDFESSVKAIYAEFVSLFAHDYLTECAYPLLIKIAPDFGSPFGSPETNVRGDGFRIGLHWADWSQYDADTLIPCYLYEMGHEFMHYFFLAKQTNESGKLLPIHSYRFQRWNEEIICGGMQLYMLRRLDKSFSFKGEKLTDYLENRLLEKHYPKQYGSMKSGPMTLAEFETLSGSDEKVKSEWHPEVRFMYEMLLLYKDADIRNLLDLNDYLVVKNPYVWGLGYIDYEKWSNEYTGSANFISDLRRIQPKLYIS